MQPNAFDLLTKMIEYDPDKRITAEVCNYSFKKYCILNSCLDI